MEAIGRKKDIVDLLYERERISVRELASRLYVSEMTVRRDLLALERQGIVRRYRGGAVLSTAGSEMPISRRFFVDEDEKKELGKQAERYLFDGMTVYIDSSSTCQYIIPHLASFKSVTLITNSVSALLSAAKLSLSCILLGGRYYGRDMCFVGEHAEEMAGRYHVDVAFFSTLGLSPSGAITDPDADQTAVRRAVMRTAEKSVFLFEESKLGKTYLYHLCDRKEADGVLISSR